jgi:hypothetical protein
VPSLSAYIQSPGTHPSSYRLFFLLKLVRWSVLVLNLLIEPTFN